MLDFQVILVFVVVVFIIISLYAGILGPAFTFVVGVFTLGIFKVITPHEILSGFANQQVMVILILLLIGDIIRKTAIAEIVFDKYFRRARTYRGFMQRMLLMVAAFSAFLNNTPLVAVMMPYVTTWSKRFGISLSKLLIPLSYAAILGGCATLIGTSTNMIVNGMVIDQHIIPGLPELHIFDFSLIGVPMIIIGSLYLLLFGNQLLPAYKTPDEENEIRSRTYLIEAQIKKTSSLIGQTIEESGLRNLPGIYLVEIQRKQHKIFVVTNNLLIEQGDILKFAGDNTQISQLTNPEYGLTIPSAGMLQKKRQANLIEIVISPNSDMIGKPLKEINFRAHYDAAVIGIYRNEEVLPPRIREAIIKPGDVLLLYTGTDFLERARDARDFYFFSKVGELEKIQFYKIYILLGGLIAAIVLSALNLVSLFMSLVILLMIAFVLKMTNPKELPKSIDYNLGLIIVMSLALGTALIKTGAAGMLAHYIISLLHPLGKMAVLSGIYVITAILAAYVTNKAAVAIMFPISLAASMEMGLPAMPFILVVAFAAAANFLTPIGYQTNLMIYGPGGYRFKDFMRIGLPLTFLYMIVALALLAWKYF